MFVRGGRLGRVGRLGREGVAVGFKYVDGPGSKMKLQEAPTDKGQASFMVSHYHL